MCNIDTSIYFDVPYVAHCFEINYLNQNLDYFDVDDGS